ncbi:MAG: ion channel [Alphaproteobacteria bacterium]
MIVFIGWVIASALVLLTIGIHYEIMRIVSDILIPWGLKKLHDRRIIMLMMAALIVGHILEIWIFAIAMLCITFAPQLGYLSGNYDNTLNSLLYFSAVNYTSLGYGDIHPHGAIRSLFVSETLAGLMMIAWSASFTYLKMEQIWSLKLHRSKNMSANA